MKRKPKKLYKFLRTNLKSDRGNHTWKVGEWYAVNGELSICNKGFHASKTPRQALGYVAGEVLAEVEVRGDSVVKTDKECWSEMRVVKAYHWKKEDSVALAIFAAEQVIDLYEKQYSNDKRPRGAIEAAKAYLEDPSEKNRKAAWAAAGAAGAAAWAAAEAAWAAWAADKKKLVAKVDKWFADRITKLEEIK